MANSLKFKRLLSDVLLVDVEPVPSTTKGGLIIADPDKEPIRVGKVLMAGPGRRYRDKLVPMEKDIIGKRVAFIAAASDTKQGQQLRTLLDENRRLIRLGDCLFIVEGDVEISA